jgi:hypothetical protein
MADMEVREEHVVFVIESLSKREVLHGMSEGKALTSALMLAQIPSRCFVAYDKECFKESLNLIAQAAANKIEQFPSRGQPPIKTNYIPHLDIAAHGNENGIGLTSSQSVGWEELRTWLIGFAVSAGHLITDRYGGFLVTFSTCHGHFAHKMFGMGTPYPCVAVVGPKEQVTPADTLTAFVVFYHQWLHKKKHRSLKSVVRAMNVGAGLRDVYVGTSCESFGPFADVD